MSDKPDKYKEFFSNNKETIISKLITIIQDKKGNEALKFLYELIVFSIREINTKNIKPLISLMKEKYVNNSLLKEFLDFYLAQTLWIFGVKFNVIKNDKDNIKVENIKNFVNLLINEKLITKNRLIETLDETTLEQIGLINQKDFKAKITPKNTKLFEHHKFNLLREESEGFSKLLSFIYDINELQNNLEEKEINTVLDELVKIIGYFNLDSYRVLDNALEIFKYSPFNINYIKIFDILNKKKLFP